MSTALNTANTALKKSGGMLDGFKEFIARGNAVDLAVGVVIGAAFGAVVTSIVDGFFNPLIGAIFGQPNFDAVWTLTVNGVAIQPFVIVTALVNFLIIAAVIYYCVVVPLNKLAAKRAVVEPEPVEQSEESLLLTEIRDILAAKSKA